MNCHPPKTRKALGLPLFQHIGVESLTNPRDNVKIGAFGVLEFSSLLSLGGRGKMFGDTVFILSEDTV